MTGVLGWIVQAALLIALGAAAGWLTNAARRRKRNDGRGGRETEDADVRDAWGVAARKPAYGIPMPARVLSGLLGVGICIVLAINSSPLTWGRVKDGLGFAALGILFVYAAVAGRSPAWLESVYEADRLVGKATKWPGKQNP